MAKTIFLVDDSAVMLMSVKQNLELAGFKVETAKDGLEAFNRIKGGLKPDLIITDINMPNMNGFQLLAEIKGDDKLKHLPVLMVTAEARKEDIVAAAQGGAAGYIVKPFTKATLEEKVTLILKKMGL